MTLQKNITAVTSQLKLELTPNDVTYDVSSYPQFSWKFAHFVRVAFRYLLLTTRPQRLWSGGQQKQLQAQNKIESKKTAAEGGLVVQNRFIPMMSKK